MLPSTPRRALYSGTAALLIGGSLAACGSSSPGGSSSGGGSNAITIDYIQKQGDQQYFIDEANGAKDEAAKLGGVQIHVVNVGTDSNAAINAVNSAVAQAYSGVAIVVPDQKIGPQVVSTLKQANIPTVASDDPIKDGSGNAIPFVGFDSLQMGTQVGQAAGQLFKTANWSASDTRMLSVFKQDLSDCQLRDQGEEQAFAAAAGVSIPVVKVGTDNSATDAQSRVGATITANQGVKHWVVVACNDEGETGATQALANAGFGGDSVIGVGLGAYLTCKDWQAGKQTGNKSALFISGRNVGANAVKALVDQIRNNKPLPAKTIAPTLIVDATNYKQDGVQCT
jgi:L-arabinose transport system substrate-binding protein